MTRRPGAKRTTTAAPTARTASSRHRFGFSPRMTTRARRRRHQRVGDIPVTTVNARVAPRMATTRPVCRCRRARRSRVARRHREQDHHDQNDDQEHDEAATQGSPRNRRPAGRRWIDSFIGGVGLGSNKISRTPTRTPRPRSADGIDDSPRRGGDAPGSPGWTVRTSRPVIVTSSVPPNALASSTFPHARERCP